jgi:hypothetical protein
MDHVRDHHDVLLLVPSTFTSYAPRLREILAAAVQPPAANSVQRTHFALYFFSRFLAAPRFRRLVSGLGEFLTSPKPYRRKKKFFAIHEDKADIKGATTTYDGAATPHHYPRNRDTLKTHRVFRGSVRKTFLCAASRKFAP